MSYLIGFVAGFLIGLFIGLLIANRYGPVCDHWMRHYCWIPEYGVWSWLCGDVGFWSCLCGKVGGSFGKHGASYDDWADDELDDYYGEDKCDDDH